MKSIADIWFPAAVVAFAASAAIGTGRGSVEPHMIPAPVEISAGDTVKYPHDGWKLRRKGSLEGLEDALPADSLLISFEEDFPDTIPHLTARDTIKVPDSLRLTDPFRYKYYVALIDSLTHVIVRDSLRHSSDSLKVSSDTLRERFVRMHMAEDSIRSAEDFRQAMSDSLDWRMIDSIFVSDSTAAAKAAFLQWYNSLGKKERKKYDAERMLPIRLAKMDSLKKVKEDKQAVRDSITEYTPRILETFALPDSLQYKRIVAWTTDPDFHQMNTFIPDTTYNHHYRDDYPYQRKDVNASWLGVPGSPLQYYNYFNRKSDERVDFYDALEAWTYSPRTLPHHNSKTPFTELAYFGTLFSKEAKETDNLHIFTTQNITPALNFSLLYDRFGGGGFLANETTTNKTFAAQSNYLGKKYMMHAGYIYNMASRQENGGVADNYWIRDTTLNDSRDVPVIFGNGTSSLVKKNTVFLEQQLRIPFTFINRIKARKDSTYVFDADSLDRDITTAFIGHSSEFSSYRRNYTDRITDEAGREFYNNVFNFNPNASNDSLHVSKIDNKVFMRLQPWSSDGVVSKLDIGIGDYVKTYFDSTSLRPMKHRENSAYLYAGAEGQIRKSISWNAKANYVFLGHDFGDMGIEADASLRIYPFRKARKSPASLSAHFETNLMEPNFYQQHLCTNHFSWDNEFSKISTTKIQGKVDIPHWKFNATAGYALLGNNIYYDTLGVVRQNSTPMSVFNASVRKEFVLGPVHLDNRALLQFSSNREVLPLPLAAFNARYYFQFVVQRNEAKTRNVMEMQIGIDAWYNTPWYAPAYNPALGVFHNQNRNQYTNGPYFDAFVNVQWKRACIFVKYLNAGSGWPMKHKDYFSADHYIVGNRSGLDGLKIGIYWPFYTQSGKPHSHGTSGAGPSARGANERPHSEDSMPGGRMGGTGRGGRSLQTR